MNIRTDTTRLILKNYCESDLEDFHRLKSNPLVWRFSTKIQSSSIEETQNCLNAILKNYNEGKHDFMALFLKDTGEYIGEAGVLAHIMPNNRVVVGYNLLPEYWGNGYATEITKALVKYLFKDKRVERIEAHVCDGNIESSKVLEKSGFIKEGVLRNFIYIDNKYKNLLYYGMIKDDYKV